MTPKLPLQRLILPRLITTLGLFLLALLLVNLLLARWAIGLADDAIRAQLQSGVTYFGSAIALWGALSALHLRPP
ncbi:MAG: hypothetical protein KAI47_27700, partial [Deltaproteobacteria bacterium]|nr:hypothetical protein [Deltaproteobacteria bacterium]